MAEIFRKKQGSGASGTNLNKPIRVVPSMFWLMYVGGAIIVFAVVMWICFGWTLETANVTGLYHPGASAEGEVICFPPLTVAKRIQPGMEITAYAAGFEQQKHGHIKGKVTYVDDYVTSVDAMRALLGDDMLVNAFLQSGPVCAVVCKLDVDPDARNGYEWSSERGGDVHLQDGTYMSVSVELSRVRPFALGLPLLYELFS